MLKNYTVIVKNVKVDKTRQLIRYLNNDKHKNHTKHETEIFELSNSDKFEKITDDKIKQNELNYYNPEKRGLDKFGNPISGGKKLKVANKSFTFNLPKSYKNFATKEQMIKIDRTLKAEIIKIYKNFGVEIVEEELYSVLHFQEGRHIHLVAPYLDKDGNTIRQVKPKGFTSRLKVIFSQIVDRELGLNIEDYKKLNVADNSKSLMVIAIEQNIDWYEQLIRMDGGATTFYKTQITKMKRLLKNEDEITQKQLEEAQENIEKAVKFRKMNGMKSPQTPFS